jgi:hypothetical protein
VRRERQHNIVARTPIQLNNDNPTFDAKKRKWQKLSANLEVQLSKKTIRHFKLLPTSYHVKGYRSVLAKHEWEQQ